MVALDRLGTLSTPPACYSGQCCRLRSPGPSAGPGPGATAWTHSAGLTISGTNPVTVNGDNGSYGTGCQRNTHRYPGTYTWVATYSGNSPNTLARRGDVSARSLTTDEEVIVGA